MLPLNVKSGAMPTAVWKLDVAINHRRSIPPATLPGISRSIWELVPSQLKAVSRLCATKVWPAISMRISTYCAAGSAPIPDITSSITVKWNAAPLTAGVSNTSSAAISLASWGMGFSRG